LSAIGRAVKSAAEVRSWTLLRRAIKPGALAPQINEVEGRPAFDALAARSSPITEAMGSLEPAEAPIPAVTPPPVMTRALSLGRGNASSCPFADLA